ncbi:MAG: MaoC family dehydratase [Caulobacteraceae bacterium]
MTGTCFEDLKVGDCAETVHTVTDEDLRAFAAVSGDTNPVHLDEAYAAATPFKTRIAHGMLAGAYVSAVLGTQLPGPGSIYLSQTMAFKRPIRIGDEVTTRVTVTALDPDKGRATFATLVLANGKTAVDGEALIQPPRKPAA